MISTRRPETAELTLENAAMLAEVQKWPAQNPAFQLMFTTKEFLLARLRLGGEPGRIATEQARAVWLLIEGEEVERLPGGKLSSRLG